MPQPLKLSQSLEDYLKMVHILCLENKGIAHVKDIATRLSVKMPSVNKAMNELKKLDLVIQEPYTGISLSPIGKKTAAKILARHFLLKSMLLKLGVSEKMDPLLNMSFASLAVIPNLRLTTLGVVDVEKFKLI